jgi:hypothetical protein
MRYYGFGLVFVFHCILNFGAFGKFTACVTSTQSSKHLVTPCQLRNAGLLFNVRSVSTSSTHEKTLIISSKLKKDIIHTYKSYGKA